MKLEVPTPIETSKAPADGRWLVQDNVPGDTILAYLPPDNGKVEINLFGLTLDSESSKSGHQIHSETLEKVLQQINGWRNRATGLYLHGVLTNSYLGANSRWARQGEGSDKIVLLDMATEKEWRNPFKTYESRNGRLRDFYFQAIYDVPGTYSRISVSDTYIYDAGLNSESSLKLQTMRAIERGNEGLLLRKADALPSKEKTGDFLLINPAHHEFVRVKDVFAGAGPLSSVADHFTCETNDGKVLEVCSGMNIEQRKKLIRDFKAGKTLNIVLQTVGGKSFFFSF